MASTSAISSGIFNHPAESEPGPGDDKKYARFVIHSNHKVFSRAINSLSKLGVDLYIEPSELGLSIKSFNKTKSAYGLFLFSTEFFSEVETSILSEDPSSNRLCRISMKCALSLFKGVQFSEKTFVSCEFRIDPTSDVFNVQLLYAYDVTKTFEINLLETHTSFRTTIDKSTLQNLTVITPNLMTSILQSLGNNEELIIQTTKDDFILKNYFANDDDNRKIVKTQAKLSLSHLERHNNVINTEIALSLKEFMSVLTFADQNNALLSLYYDEPGKPLVVALEGDIVYSAEFIIATVEAENMEADEHREISTQHISRSNTQGSRANNSRRSRLTINTSSQPRITSMFHSSTHRKNNSVIDSSASEPPAKAPRAASMEEIHNEVSAEDNVDEPIVDEPIVDEPMNIDNNMNTVSMSGITLPVDDMDNITDINDDIALPPPETPPPVEENEEEELADTPPPSDQRMILAELKMEKKENGRTTNTFRRYFLGATSATQHASQKLLDRTVLADESDAEE